MLESWKGIAAHLKRDIRTCQRWELELGLPVHRLDGSPRARVFAYTDELDQWLEGKLHHEIGDRRLKTWQMAALAVAITVLTGSAIYRAVIWPSRHPARKIPLAVMYAVNNSGDKSLDERLRWQIPYYLSMDLAQSKYISILPHDRLIQVLHDLNQMDEAHHQSDTLDRIAGSSHVEYFVLPSFTRTGDGLWVSFTIRKAGSDEVVGTPDGIRVKSAEDLPALAMELSRRVKTRLNLSTGKISADNRPDLGRIATRSSAAAGYFVQGEIEHAKGDYEASIRSLERAVQEDPDFAMAYLKIAINAEYLGDYGRARPNLEKALSLADRASERDRWLIRGHAALAMDETAEAIKSYQKLTEIAPEDEEARLSLGGIRRNLEDWDPALEQFEKVLSFDPKSTVALGNEVFIYTAKGWYERAIGLCEGGLIIAPDNAFLVRQLPLLYIIQGRFDLAATALVKALARMPDDVEIQGLEGGLSQLRGDWPAARRIYERLRQRGEVTPGAVDLRGRAWSIRLSIEEGAYAQARQSLLEGIELARLANRLEDEIDLRSCLAYIELQTGRASQAEEALIPALETVRDGIARRLQKDVLHFTGLAAVEMGRTEDARRIGEELRQSIERTGCLKEIRRYEHLMGRIALAEGRPGEAVLRMEKALSLLPAQRENVDMQAFYEDGLAEAYDRNGDPTRALEIYQKILALTTGRLRWGDIYARSFYGMGRICQRAGRDVEAAAYFRRFLELWKNADDGLPEIADARRQLDALSAK